MIFDNSEWDCNLDLWAQFPLTQPRARKPTHHQRPFVPSLLSLQVWNCHLYLGCLFQARLVLFSVQPISNQILTKYWTESSITFTRIGLQLKIYLSVLTKGPQGQIHWVEDQRLNLVSPKLLDDMGTVAPAKTSKPVLLTKTGVSSLTGIIRMWTTAGTLVLESVLPTRVNSSTRVSFPLWTY